LVGRFALLSDYQETRGAVQGVFVEWVLVGVLWVFWVLVGVLGSDEF
jgi:hypothetical protein